MKKWLVIFLFTTLMGLMNLGIVITEKMAYGESIPFQYPFVHEMTGTYTVLLLLPFLLWFFKKFPIRRKNLLTRIPLHLLVSVVFGVCHTMLMALSRILIYIQAADGISETIFYVLVNLWNCFFCEFITEEPGTKIEDSPFGTGVNQGSPSSAANAIESPFSL